MGSTTGNGPSGFAPASASSSSEIRLVETTLSKHDPDAAAYDSVLLLAYGAPETMEQVRPFLDNVLRGLRVPRERYEAVVHHYELIGGHSPLNALTARQASMLRAVLADEGLNLSVHFGMRFAQPFIFTAIRDIIRAGRRRTLSIILSPYRSEPSFDKYVESVREVLDAADPATSPVVDFVEPWFDNVYFARAQAGRVHAALEAIPAERRDAAELIFTAHSIPTAVASRGPYVQQIEAVCRAVAEENLGRGWKLAWQSRSGSPHVPWLEPDVNEMLRSLRASGAADVVLCPVGFVSDHVEVLYDLDIEAAATCREIGLNMVRAATVNDDPVFIQGLASIVRERLGNSVTRREGSAS